MTGTTLDRFAAMVAAPTDADTVAAAFAEHLASVTTDTLPSAARSQWGQLTRLLKSQTGNPVPGRAIAAIKSWPAARVDALLEHIRAIHAILEKTENDRLEDEIRDKIRHAYL
jgi:hypothetical protein